MHIANKKTTLNSSYIHNVTSTFFSLEKNDLNNEIITIYCPHCGKEFHIKPRQLGREVRCSSCHNHILLERPVSTPLAEKPAIPPVIEEIEVPAPPPQALVEPVQGTHKQAEESGATDSKEELGKILKAKRCESADVDMTPMVDIVFLLLIFFMVTASFAMQKSIESPPPESDEASSQEMKIEQLENDDDNIIIRIERDDSVWIEDEEAPSRQSLIRLLRRHREPDATGRRPNTLLVFIDPQAYYETVVMALDAGNAVGIENIRLASLDDE